MIHSTNKSVRLLVKSTAERYGLECHRWSSLGSLVTICRPDPRRYAPSRWLADVYINGCYITVRWNAQMKPLSARVELSDPGFCEKLADAIKRCAFA